MHDESQTQEQAAPDASGQSAAQEAPQSEAPQPEAAQPSTDAEPTADVADGSPAPEPQAGGDVSTTPATASAPLPGVPAQPVNAVAEDGSIPGPRMEPERIGEAISPRQA
jgi:hypothetical protein